MRQEARAGCEAGGSLLFFHVGGRLTSIDGESRVCSRHEPARTGPLLALSLAVPVGRAERWAVLCAWPLTAACRKGIDHSLRYFWDLPNSC